MQAMGETPVRIAAEQWGRAFVAIHCDHCGEAHLVPEGVVPVRCPLCAQGPVSLHPASLREEPPELVLPFAVSETRLAGLLDEWTRGVPFPAAELKGSVLAQRAQRYFVPMWLVDGLVEGAWRAEMGFDYQVVSYQDRYREGAGWKSQEVAETRVRWEPRLGRISRRYENVPAPALDDTRTQAPRPAPSDLGRGVGYSPAALEGAAVRVPTLEPRAAWPQAQGAFVQAAQADCQRAAAADHCRHFALEAEYQGLHWTQLLLPAYVTWYQEEGQAWPVVVNGQTGQVSGARRASARRAKRVSLTLGAVALVLAVLGGLLALLGLTFPRVAAFGVLLLVLGLLLALAAPIPAISAAVHNRGSAPPGERR